MSAVNQAILGNEFALESERIDLLCTALAQSRKGVKVDPQLILHLKEIQERVFLQRLEGGWSRLIQEELTGLELDVLACVLAPEMEPRVGWAYHELQPGVGQPYPSPALIQELLALDQAEANAMLATFGARGALRRLRLVQVVEDLYTPVRSGPGVPWGSMGRSATNQVPPPGAVLVAQKAMWDDLVLPPERKTMLNEFLLWIEKRHVVIGEWGGASVGGPVALFAGPSGTGKTFAASVIAGRLGWNLYRVDLGRLVSKYIGETEKNLNALFEAADGQRMILQFDEADSLFGKRGEVREARDRYANMEVSHLLARIEAHNGACILTSNLRKHLDPAFARRFQIVVEFPRPDVEVRTQLWKKLLPPRAPRTADVQPEVLAKAVSLSGGSIRNAALHAAYLAAGEDQPINLGHIALALWRELSKEGREISRQELGILATHLPRSL